MPGRAPDRHHRAEQHLGLEALARATVEVGDHLLVLLRQERHDVGLAVAVDVHDRHVDRTGPRIDRVALELRAGPVRGLVLVHEDSADRVPAKRRNRQVEVAVAVEVGRLHVGGARDPGHEDGLLELQRSRLAQPHDAALLVVGGQEVAEVGESAGPACRPGRGPPSWRGPGSVRARSPGARRAF
jgi:hypothetical protein